MYECGKHLFYSTYECICKNLENHTGRESRGPKIYEGNNDRQTPQGSIGTWAQVEGGKEEANGRGKQRQTQAQGVGRRDELQNMAGGGCGKIP